MSEKSGKWAALYVNSAVYLLASYPRNPSVEALQNFNFLNVDFSSYSDT
jgi:hypothetical protein